MRKFEDLTGKKFGSLTVVEYGGQYKPSGNIYWRCKCECGNYTNTSGSSLRSGKSVSCGRCSASKRARERNYRHGDFGSRLYEIWRQMHRRCYGENTKAYKHYGGRGITICEEWKEYEKFREWAVSCGYNDSLTIDRIDVNRNYCPENCRWATAKQQANNRRSNHNIEYMGEIHTVSEWADIFGVKQTHLWKALSKNNWNLNELVIRGWFDEHRKIS